MTAALHAGAPPQDTVHMIVTGGALAAAVISAAGMVAVAILRRRADRPAGSNPAQLGTSMARPRHWAALYGRGRSGARHRR